MKALQTIIELERATNSLAMRIAMVDESKLHPSDPAKNKYVLYLIPWGARKEKMIHRLFSESARAAGRKTGELRLFYAGDTPTDLRAGLYAGGGAEFKFLVPAGSPLAPYLINQEKKYGNEDLSFLWAKPQKGRTRHRLVSTKRKGEYRFVHRVPGLKSNAVIIADERYPGTTPPGSVAEFLEEFL
jgi:hypothetical protein